jgi:4-hydroxy-tetrahydrodipicolinate synthase
MRLLPVDLAPSAGPLRKIEGRMIVLIVEGIIPAMVTPFDRDEQLNEPALKEMTVRFVQAGVHGLFCLGTNGEFFSLTFDEKVRVAEIVAEASEGKLPVYAGAGCTSTAETIRLAQRLEAVGVQALSVITPYFLTYTQEELFRHFAQVAEATTLPIVLYNIPARTSNALQPKTFLNRMGVPAGPSRSPAGPLSQQADNEMQLILAKYERQGLLTKQ